MTMSRRLLHQLLGLLISFVVLAVPAAVYAQDSTPIAADLIVTVRNMPGAPISGLTVQIHAGADTPILAQVVTDAQGQAVFATISVSQVRVRVVGTLASGAHLYQIGADAPGVAVFLGPPPTTLDLRVDSDGMVLPNPVTMIDPVPYGPTIATPAPGPDGIGRSVFPTSTTYTAPVGPTVAAATNTSSMTSPLPSSPAPMAPSVEAGAQSAAPASATLRWWVVGIGSAIVVVVGGLLLIRLLGRRRA